jgi:hypothetical protein
MRTTLKAMSLAALISVIGAASARAADICFEAEDANQIVKPFQIDTKAGASGGHYVVQPLHSGRPPQVKCWATYKIKIKDAGRYVLWGRAWWPNGCANSVDMKVDNNSRVTLGQDGTYMRWHWVRVKGKTFELSAGVHVITMVNREDGPGLDEFYLTTDEDYVPGGMSAAVTPTPGAIVK